MIDPSRYDNFASRKILRSIDQVDANKLRLAYLETNQACLTNVPTFKNHNACCVVAIQAYRPTGFKCEGDCRFNLILNSCIDIR